MAGGRFGSKEIGLPDCGSARRAFSHFESLASVLNCSERALVNWEQGEPVSAVCAARGRELQRLFEQLTSLMKPEEVGPWLNTEMEEFEGRRPAHLICQGETGRVWESLYFLRSGQPD